MDAAAFARRAIALADADHGAASRSRGWVFFDGSVIDAAAALQHLTGEPVLATIGPSHRYYRQVFLTPFSSEISVTERRHGFDAAVAEYRRLLEAYPPLGYVDGAFASAPTNGPTSVE